MVNRTQKFCSTPLDHSAALKIERKMSHLNFAFDRHAFIGTVMHYILVISIGAVHKRLQQSWVEEGLCSADIFRIRGERVSSDADVRTF